MSIFILVFHSKLLQRNMEMFSNTNIWDKLSSTGVNKKKNENLFQWKTQARFKGSKDEDEDKYKDKETEK